MFYVFNSNSTLVTFFMSEGSARFEASKLDGWYYTTKFDATGRELAQIKRHEDRYAAWKRGQGVCLTK